MYKSASDTGYDYDDFDRFDLLQYLKFDTILDVGSGPCVLKSWLESKNIKCEYEAVDIREDSLAMCSCPSYTSIPDKQYDIVCLFGTCGYISPEIDNKKVLYSLLTKSIKQSKKYLIFSVIINVTSQRVISFTADEIIKFLNDLGITKYKTFIHEKNSECIIFCEMC